MTGARQRKGRRPSDEQRRRIEHEKVEKDSRDDRAGVAVSKATHVKPSESTPAKPSPPTTDFDLTFQDPTRRPSPAQLFELFRDDQ